MTHRPRGILILESKKQSAPRVLEILARRNVLGEVVKTKAQAISKLHRGNYTMLIADADDLESPLREALGRIGQEHPLLIQVILDSSPSIQRAVTALQAGARTYLPQPLEESQIQDLIAAVVPDRPCPILPQCLEAGTEIVGRSNALKETLAMASRVAQTALPVLITGESGTGKELLSQFVHARSRRSQGPFIRVNCAALSESLLESELFGHEAGAFTGAVSQRKGRFERAHLGTLLLDEITETSPRLQAQLLRVLEGQDLERLGGSETLRVDVRVLATTNRDLASEVQAGRFRADLYYRLAGVHLQMPALRDRLEDLEDLLWHFVNRYSPETCRHIEQIESAMMGRLKQMSFPGNVRQLRNLIRAALAMGQGPILSVSDLSHVRTCPPPARLAPARSDTLKLQELERRAIVEALRRTKSHQAKAADLLGITDRTLREKLRRYRADGKWPRKKDKQVEIPCQELPA